MILLALIIVTVDALNFTEAQCTGLTNTAVIVGSRVTFECYYHNHDLTNQSGWFHYKSTFGREQLSSGNRVKKQFKDRYQVKIDMENKRTSLSINAAKLEDAGLYAWTQFSDGVHSYTTVDLIVLAPLDKMCHVSHSIWNMGSYQVGEFTEFEVHCSVNYTGNWSPTISCELPFEQNIVSSSSNVSKSVSLTQRITALRNMSNTTFICTTSINKDGLHFTDISDDNSSQEHANNVQYFSLDWTSPVVHVVYGPELVTITTANGNETVNPGNVLKCTSIGNPPPHYEWIDLTTNRSVKGPQWTVPDVRISNDHQSVLILQCTAKIEALGKIYSSTVEKTLTVIRSPALSHGITKMARKWHGGSTNISPVPTTGSNPSLLTIYSNSSHVVTISAVISSLDEVTSDGTNFFIVIGGIFVLASVTVNAVLLLKLHRSRHPRRIVEMPAAAGAVGVYQETTREDLDRSGLSSAYEMLPTRSLYENIDLAPERRDQVSDYVNLPKDHVPPYANIPLVD